MTTINDRLESLENSYNDFAVILRSVVETQREHTTILKTVAELLDNVVSNRMSRDSGTSRTSTPRC